MSTPTRILVVEDEARIAEVVQSYLEREGHMVMRAATGEDALADFARRRPDLVVLDLGLPRLAGEDACRRIRAASDVPIIMLTAKDGEEDLVKGLQLGADDYLTKPFSPRELTARVRALLRRARSDDEPQADVLERAGERLVVDSARRPHRIGVPAAADARPLPRARVHALRARRQGAGLPVRGVRAHHRRARQEPAPQAGRRRARSATDPHGLRPRLRVRRGAEVKRGLRLRLALTHAFVALLAIAVVAAIVFVAGGRRFDSYLSEVQRSRNEAVVNILTQTYRAPDGWDAAAIYALSQIARLNNVDVAVYSPRGQLLFTVQGRLLGGGMMGGGNGMMGGATSGATPAPQATSLSRDQLEVQSYPVVADGQKVGTAEVYALRNARAAAESAYQTALTRNLVIAALVAAVFAFLISLFVSRRITGPLEELTDAAEDVAGGNLAVRVSPRADDEVGALAAAFNAMADRLARDEQWRRDMTADLSHELRTPLATIQSRIEALEDGVLPATPENLRVIGVEVERLGRLLGALRSLNELESEDVSVEHERVDLADVGRDAIAHAETVYAAKGVTLDGDLAPVTVKGDRDRLLQVAACLLYTSD